MEEQNKNARRRERIKTILIVFLVILLLLTFFSNTILNYSLPTVSAQYAGNGTITEKIRGTGTVSANQNYEVSAEGSRTVATVYIKSGDEVHVGDKLFALDAEDNAAEIKEAENALQASELAYQKALLTVAPDYTAENQEIADARADLQNAINRLNSAGGQTQSVSDEDYQQAMTDAKNASSEMETLTGYLTAVTAGELENIPLQYTAGLQNAQTAVQNAEQKLQESQTALESVEILVSSEQQQATVLSLERDVEKAQVAYDRAKADYDSALTNGIPEVSENSEEENIPMFSLTDLQRAMEDAEQTLRYAKEDLQNAKNTLQEIQKQEQEQAAKKLAVTQAQEELNTAKANYQKAAADVSTLIQTDLEIASQKADSAQGIISAYESQQMENSGESVTTLQEAVSQQERALQSLLMQLAEKKKEDALTQQLNDLDLKSQQNAIDQQKEALEKLRKDKDSKIITSKNEGIVNTVNCAAGDKVMDGDSLASITLTGSGCTVQFSVTAEQARKLHTGMTAEIVNQYYSDITATLVAIRKDTESSDKSGKILVFDITGSEVNIGDVLALSIKTSSENYDCVVPSSAVMEDNNGKFILVMQVKNTPLGNRYYVTRSDVTVLAHDEINSAVQGDVSSSSFIVTNSEKPLTPGMQVRMEENS